MPVAVGFGKPKTFLVHASGCVALAEVQRAMDDMLANAGLAPGCNMLVDARAVTGAPPSSELRQVANELRPLIARGLGSMAIVTRPGFVYGVARMFAVFAEVVHLDVDAFTDMESAQRWLDARDG